MKTRKDNGKSLFRSNQHKREAIVKYSQLILKGDGLSTLTEELEKEFGFNQNQCAAFLSNVRDVIAEVTAESNEQVVQTHIEIYEDIFRRFDRLGHAKGKMKVLEQKEKLLKLYEDETNEVVVNTQNNIMIETHYDVAKLTEEQKQRFQYLISKATQNEKSSKK